MLKYLIGLMLFFQAPIPVIGLENAPIVFTGPSPIDSIVAHVVAFDSLRVVVIWTHLADSLGGPEDSTIFNIKATKTIRFMGGGTVAPNTKRHRMFRVNTADTFKVARPVIGDSVIFTADSIAQCKAGLCGVPGSAAWGYMRTQRPPAMTFIRVTTDSF